MLVRMIDGQWPDGRVVVPMKFACARHASGKAYRANVGRRENVQVFRGRIHAVGKERRKCIFDVRGDDKYVTACSGRVNCKQNRRDLQICRDNLIVEAHWFVEA